MVLLKQILSILVGQGLTIAALALALFFAFGGYPWAIGLYVLGFAIIALKGALSAFSRPHLRLGEAISADTVGWLLARRQGAMAQGRGLLHVVGLAGAWPSAILLAIYVLVAAASRYRIRKEIHLDIVRELQPTHLFAAIVYGFQCWLYFRYFAGGVPDFHLDLYVITHVIGFVSFLLMMATNKALMKNFSMSELPPFTYYLATALAFLVASIATELMLMDWSQTPGKEGIYASFQRLYSAVPDLDIAKAVEAADSFPALAGSVIDIFRALTAIEWFRLAVSLFVMSTVLRAVFGAASYKRDDEDLLCLAFALGAVGHSRKAAALALAIDARARRFQAQAALALMAGDLAGFDRYSRRHIAFDFMDLPERDMACLQTASALGVALYARLDDNSARWLIDLAHAKTGKLWVTRSVCGGLTFNAAIGRDQARRLGDDPPVVAVRRFDEMVMTIGTKPLADWLAEFDAAVPEAERCELAVAALGMLAAGVAGRSLSGHDRHAAYDALLTRAEAALPEADDGIGARTLRGQFCPLFAAIARNEPTMRERAEAIAATIRGALPDSVKREFHVPDYDLIV